MAKVRLVEDDNLNRDMLSRCLARKNYTVVMDVNGAEGVKMAD